MTTECVVDMTTSETASLRAINLPELEVEMEGTLEEMKHKKIEKAKDGHGQFGRPRHEKPTLWERDLRASTKPLQEHRGRAEAA